MHAQPLHADVDWLVTYSMAPQVYPLAADGKPAVQLDGHSGMGLVIEAAG